MPLSQPPGEAQVDFGQALVNFDGTLKKVIFFVMSMVHSDAMFVMAFPRECTESFLEAHVRAFDFFGCVPKRISYDNTRVAVAKIFTHHKRKHTAEFKRIISHYLFEPYFCNVRRPNEKGIVEGSVKYARLNFMVPVPQVKDWNKASVIKLRSIRLLDTLRLSLDELLSDYDYFNGRLKELRKLLADNLDKGVLGRRMDLLKTHPSVGPVVSCQFATELYHYKDFSSTRQVYKYLGLSPRVSQSGEKKSTGPINKAANGRLRNNLIQASWNWVRTDIEAKKCFWRIYDNCGGIKQKAIVVMARKMSGYLWAMLMNDQPYDANKAKCRHN